MKAQKVRTTTRNITAVPELWFNRVATVGELKALLAAMPDEMPLGLRGSYGNGGHTGLALTTRVSFSALPQPSSGYTTGYTPARVLSPAIVLGATPSLPACSQSRRTNMSASPHS